MLARYHRQILNTVLGNEVNPQAFRVILDANLGQDGLRGQLGHPEFHYDECAFFAGNRFVESQRQIIMETLNNRMVSSASFNPAPAWRAFGRLTHAVQDFYAHSNYVQLWLDQRKPNQDGAIPEGIEPLVPQLMSNPDLRSGRTYYPLEFLTFIPFLAPMVTSWLPHDAHAWMNLDSPARGPLFAFALAAAQKRTSFEYQTICTGLSPKSLQCFKGIS